MNSSTGPLISIGIPVYNGSPKIETALRSVLQQTYTNIEVVVSDNASTDDTREICDRVCAGDPRVRFSTHPVNRGPLENFRAVLHRARGEYFMWLGHDDQLTKDYVEACRSILDGDDDVSLVCGQASYLKDGVEVFRGDVVQLLQESPQERVAAYYNKVTDNGTFYGLMRREQLLKVKLHNVMGADWLMIASIAFMGKVITVPSITVTRSVGGSSVSYDNIARLLGLPRFQAVFPHVAIAFFAFKDIVWADPLYSLGVFQRLRLAWKCQRSIRLRHGASLWDVFRKVLSLSKQHVTQFIERRIERP